jgi:ABC-2 type transport system ATP-binding protein
MIEVESVGKRYGDFVALDDVSFRIGQGEIVGLLGPNGAGKTTLIRMLTGYFEPSAGTIRIDGVDVESDPLAAQQQIGYLPEQTPLYPEMLVQEYLGMVADFRDLAPERRQSLLAEAIWATELEEHLNRPIGALSKGFRQRVGLAQAILHEPKVLILDEPTSGLDPTQVEHVRALIQRLAQRATVLFSSHVLTEVEQVCERALVLLGGRLRADARLSDLRATHSAVVSIAEDSVARDGPNSSRRDAVEAALRGLAGVTRVSALAPRSGCLSYELSTDGDPDLCRNLFRLARDHGWELAELRPVERDLESVFRGLVAQYEGGGGGESADGALREASSPASAMDEQNEPEGAG